MTTESSGFRSPSVPEAMSVTEEQVIEALRPVEDPELFRSIVDLGMVKEVGIAGDAVDVLIALTLSLIHI